MAVAKMQKVTLIAEVRQQNHLLQTLQGMQNISIRDLTASTKANAHVQAYFEESSETSVSTCVDEYQACLNNLEQALRFIEHHGDHRQRQLGLKRIEKSLQTIEFGFDEATLNKKVAEILDLKADYQATMTAIEKAQARERQLTLWSSLDINPGALGTMAVALWLGSVGKNAAQALFSQLESLKNVYVEHVSEDEQSIRLALLYPPQAANVVQTYLTAASAQSEDYNEEEPPKAALMKIKATLQDLVENLQALTNKIGLEFASIKQLQLAEEIILARQQREIIKQRLIIAPYLTVIQGWLAEPDRALFEQELARQMGKNQVYTAFEAPTAEEIANEVPTKLVNNSLVEPFEQLTEMYSLPKYDEVDPTPWLTPFYLVFFGMMVADVGYGALMVIGTTVVLKTMTLKRSMANFVHFFQILGIPTLLWGLIYGSAFGAGLPYRPLLSTTDDVIPILLLSVVFGFIQIIVGLFIAAKQSIAKKDYLGALRQGIGWHGILFGIVIALVGSMLLHISAVTKLGIILAVMSAISIVVAAILQSSSKLVGLASGLYDLYGITSYIGDLVSYTRLMAIGISGGSIAAAFNLLVSYMPPVVRFSAGIILLIGMHGLNIFLSLLSAYVHGIRLQFVEFFGKFYEGGGRKFEAFKPAEKYFNIVVNTTKKK